MSHTTLCTAHHDVYRCPGSHTSHHDVYHHPASYSTIQHCKGRMMWDIIQQQTPLRTTTLAKYIMQPQFLQPLSGANPQQKFDSNDAENWSTSSLCLSQIELVGLIFTQYRTQSRFARALCAVGWLTAQASWIQLGKEIKAGRFCSVRFEMEQCLPGLLPCLFIV